MTVRRLLEGKGRFVPTIRSGASLQDVIDQLDIDDAGALVVTDDNEKILGLITETDIARGLKKYGRDIVDAPVEKLMTTDVVVCDIGEPLTKVLELMDEHQLHHVPVVKDGKLYGIINMLDLVKYRLGELETEAEALKAYVAGRT